MAVITLKSLHACLRLLENASELKRKMPTSPNPRTLKEGLSELSKLAGLEEAAFKDPQNIAALVGAQRFVMIWGEASVTDHVARVFDSSRVLLTVLIDPTHFEKVTPGQMGPTSGNAQARSAGKGALPADWVELNSEPTGTRAAVSPGPETMVDGLLPLLSGNAPLTCRLFRALFEHMLGFVSPATAQQGNVFLASELAGRREHGRSFLATALFILGMEADRENLIPFMMQQGLFGMPIFEHMLQNRDYCSAFLAFRRLERAFSGPATAEEAQLRVRIDRFNAQFGGEPCGAKIFEADDQDKARIDSYLAATDLLEAMALTPWCMSLEKAVSLASSNSIRSVSTIASHFERVSKDAATEAQANQGITDHLLAFARQFSADSQPA